MQQPEFRAGRTLLARAAMMGAAASAVAAVLATGWHQGWMPSLDLFDAAPVATVSAPADSRIAPGRSEIPRFDVVRVSPRGNAVMAGRADPGAEVTIERDGREIGRTTGDANGQWVMTPPQPLAPGASTFMLAARTPQGGSVAGDTPVTIVVPERETNLAARQSGPASIAPAFSTPGPARDDDRVAAPAGAGRVGVSSGRRDRAEPGATDWEPARPSAAIASAAARPVAVATPLDGPARLLTGPPVAGPPGTAARLGVDIVDYDERGAIRFAGRAPSGSVVRSYIDNVPAGDATVDAGGHWEMVPEASVATGPHRIRVDQLTAAGKVGARVELPFQRVTVTRAEVAEGRIIVQPMQTLWRIARRAYGQGVRYTEIYDANRDQISDPNRIYPGQVFTIPAVSSAGARAATAAISSPTRPFRP